MRIFFIILATSISLLAGISAEQIKVWKSQGTCEKIPPKIYRTGLLFNGGGMETFYERSMCYYMLAVKTKNREYCAKIKERKSFFFDGSGVTPKACIAAVAYALALNTPASRAKAKKAMEAYLKKQNASSASKSATTHHTAPSRPAK